MSGPAKKQSKLKLISGTDRPFRREESQPICFPAISKAPDAPDWLPNAHSVKEWNRLAPILVNLGLLTEGGLSAFGTLCALHGKLVQLWSAGEAPTGHMLSQYRNLINDFGLTPVAQGKVKPVGEREKENSFKNNGKKPA